MIRLNVFVRVNETNREKAIEAAKELTARIWGYILSRKHIKNKILFIPYYFLFMNVNVIRGFRYLSKRKGNSSGAWEKARRAGQ